MVVRGGRKLDAPFLDIRDQVTAGGEQGLLSLAFAPDYARERPLLRLLHRRRGRPADRRVPARAAPIAPTRAPRGWCCGWPTPSPTTTAACCCSGPTTCSTSAPATAAAAATSTGRAGTRRTSARCSGRSCGSIPARAAAGRTGSRTSNPFTGRSGARGEIYSYGLRNPWRFSFDRTTGDLTIGDVGQNEYEEIDFVRRGKGRGANFGWRPFEGRARYADGESAPGPRAAGDRAQALRRQLLDHGRRGRARPAPRRPARALRVRRLLQGAGRVGAALARPRARRAADVAAGRQPVVVRRGRAGAGVRRRRSTGRSTGSSRAERDGGAARPGGQPLAVHAERDQHLGGGRAIRPGWSTRARRSSRIWTRSPRRWRSAAAPAGSP